MSSLSNCEKIGMLAVILVLCVLVMGKSNVGRQKLLKEILKTFGQVASPTAVVFSVFALVLMLNKGPSSSMENTIMTEGLLISIRLNTDDIESYDIVVCI